jgi:biotin carboxylase
MQLRLTAENVKSNWSLCIGKITFFHLPGGNGIRVDTHLLDDSQPSPMMHSNAAAANC